MNQEAPVRIQDVSHSLGQGELRRQVLFDINAEIHAGETVILTGPSGSGKTTLLMLVGALRSATHGSLRVLGHELRNARPRAMEQVRRRIGFVFQQHNLLGALNAIQNVELGIRASGRSRRGRMRQRAEETLAAVGLQDHAYHRPGQLSGGQRQRVAIARALAAEPSLLLADEPTASLDGDSGRGVIDSMQRLASERGTAIMLVTHDNRILDVADRIIYLEDGRTSRFTDAVIAGNRRMMEALADNRHKQSMHDVVEEMNAGQFNQLLQNIATESQELVRATTLASDLAVKSMLEQGLFAFTRKLGQLLNAEHSSLFLVNRAESCLELRISEHLEESGPIRIPLGTGLAGAVANSGQPIRVDDAYADPRFNQDVDRRTGYVTRSIISLPVKNLAGEVFAVAQLLNRRDGHPFDSGDERRFTQYVDSLGRILEAFQRLGA